MIKYKSEKNSLLDCIAVLNLDRNGNYKLDVNDGLVVGDNSIIVEFAIRYLKNDPIFTLELSGIGYHKDIHAYKNFVLLNKDFKPNIRFIPKNSIESIFLGINNIDTNSVLSSIITQLLNQLDGLDLITV